MAHVLKDSQVTIYSYLCAYLFVYLFIYPVASFEGRQTFDTKAWAEICKRFSFLNDILRFWTYCKYESTVHNCIYLSICDFFSLNVDVQYRKPD